MPKPALVALALALAAMAPSAASRAESRLRLPYPEFFGEVPAATYDDSRERVGGAQLRIEQLDTGNVRIVSRSGIEDGAHTVAFAEMAPVESGHALEILLQESRSVDPAGVSLGVMRIDHRKGMATCSQGTGADAETLEFPLPVGDRVANVPLNLLFLPLVRGDRKDLSFQIFLCRGGPRLMDFNARVVPDPEAHGQLIEVRYGPDLGIMSTLASALIPHLSVWFDPRSPHSWAAHRLPLYSKGPEVFVIRDGVPSAWLGR
jgi:hypothetical protein